MEVTIIMKRSKLAETDTLRTDHKKIIVYEWNGQMRDTETVFYFFVFDLHFIWKWFCCNFCPTVTWTARRRGWQKKSPVPLCRLSFICYIFRLLPFLTSVTFFFLWHIDLSEIIHKLSVFWSIKLFSLHVSFVCYQLFLSFLLDWLQDYLCRYLFTSSFQSS